MSTQSYPLNASTISKDWTVAHKQLFNKAVKVTSGGTRNEKLLEFSHDGQDFRLTGDFLPAVGRDVLVDSGFNVQMGGVRLGIAKHA